MWCGEDVAAGGAVFQATIDETIEKESLVLIYALEYHESRSLFILGYNPTTILCN